MHKTHIPVDLHQEPFKRRFISVRSMFGAIQHRSSNNQHNHNKVHRVIHLHDSHTALYAIKKVSENNLIVDPTIRLESSIDLLESEDLDENRLGMQRLVLATKRVPTTPGDELVARALVYGGTKEELREERLRDIFVTFLCTVDDEDDDDDDDDDASCFSDDDDSIYSDGEDGPRGKSWDALHTLALQVVVNALEQILSTDTDDTPTASVIDFADSFWKQVVSTLIHNVELCHSREEVTMYSLKCLRLLHTLEPIVVKPLLRQTLMPYLLYLQDYGQRFLMVESEASRLIKRAEIMSTRYFEI
jgi:hypothetical protein